MATSIYRPFRTMPLGRFEAILDSAAAKAGRGPMNVGLVSTAAAAHPDFTKIIETVETRGGRVGLSSLRSVDIGAESAAAIGRSGVKASASRPSRGARK